MLSLRNLAQADKYDAHHAFFMFISYFFQRKKILNGKILRF